MSSTKVRLLFLNGITLLYYLWRINEDSKCLQSNLILNETI